MFSPPPHSSDPSFTNGSSCWSNHNIRGQQEGSYCIPVYFGGEIFSQKCSKIPFAEKYFVNNPQEEGVVQWHFRWQSRKMQNLWKYFTGKINLWRQFFWWQTENLESFFITALGWQCVQWHSFHFSSYNSKIIMHTHTHTYILADQLYSKEVQRKSIFKHWILKEVLKKRCPAQTALTALKCFIKLPYSVEVYTFSLTLFVYNQEYIMLYSWYNIFMHHVYTYNVCVCTSVIVKLKSFVLLFLHSYIHLLIFTMHTHTHKQSSPNKIIV